MEPNESDLDAFVTLSHLNLSEAHPEFSPEERAELYRSWWQMNKDSFMQLEQQGLDGRYRLVAISIVLPLSASAFQALKTGKAAVLDLRQGDIVAPGQQIRYLLVDTWIIDKPARPKFGGMEYALVLKHISQFWNPREQENMVLLIEPDVRSVRRLAKDSDFSGPYTTKDRGQLYGIEFPHRNTFADKPLEAIFEELVANIAAVKRWPVT
jgi:hypothetical protein